MQHVFNSTGHELKFKNFVRAENCTLFDEEGQSWLDLESGVWCTSLGHSHPEIVKVLSEQAALMMHSGYCYLHPLLNEAAGKILEITGLTGGKGVFLSSGSEAVEYAVKAVQNATEKRRFITMKNCYLSAYGSSGERSGDRWIEFDWMGGDNPDSIDYSEVAAFVFEPGSSLGLVQFPPEDLVRTIANRVKEAGGYLVVNEITTGIGRTGRWFGFNHYGLHPDAVAMGKGLGSGYPVSCVALSPALVEHIDLQRFHYAQSHQNDPLGAAVATKVIEVIDREGLLQRAERLGASLRERLNDLKFKHGLIKEVRGRGLMMAIEFNHDPDRSLAALVNEELLHRKIILVKRPHHEILRMDPALTVEEAQIDYFLDSMKDILAGLSASEV
jgi:acetylornithine aminotransferase